MTYPLGVWQAMLACAYVADKAALGDDGFVATARLAADLGLPAPSAAALLRRLTAAGLIETREGARGGVRLALREELTAAKAEAETATAAAAKATAAAAAAGVIPSPSKVSRTIAGGTTTGRGGARPRPRPQGGRQAHVDELRGRPGEGRA